MSFERIDIGPATLYCGDCLELLAAGVLSGADAVVSDPPYGIGYQHSGKGKTGATRNMRPIHGDDTEFDAAPWIRFCAVGANGRTGSNQNIHGVLRLGLFGVEHYHHTLPPGGTFITWDKSCGMGPNDSFADSEMIWVGTKTQRRIIRHVWKGKMRNRQGQDEFSNNNKHHPSEKPVAVMHQVFEAMRIPLGCTVLDPYMGTATTGVACLRTGRRFTGVEIDADYFAIACDRIGREWDRISGDLLYQPEDYEAAQTEAV